MTIVHYLKVWHHYVLGNTFIANINNTLSNSSPTSNNIYLHDTHHSS
ncbi:unnamed protein product [Spirodela intermedia]|uniref:Uncharacterized protein n=1 Tax=Spirodela intermedia TaxID=51605 RepID=A0A7I8LGW8_SPIIN|nr:unnamed protein product [Spirodela intermedia]